MKNTPIDRVRTTFWLSKLCDHLSTKPQKSRLNRQVETLLSYKEFKEEFLDAFEKFSDDGSKKLPHERDKLILLKGATSLDDDSLFNLYRSSAAAAEIFRFPSKSTFSKWRKGKAVPRSIFRAVAAQLDSTGAQWLDRSVGKNRLTRLFFIMDLVACNEISTNTSKSILAVYNDIIGDYRPIKLKGAIEGDESVFDFYIPGPDSRHESPYSAGSYVSKEDADCSAQTSKSENRDLSQKKNKHDFSLGLKSYAGLRLPENIAKKYNPEKPYSCFSMLISVLVSESMRESPPSLSNEIVVDLCSLSLCVLAFIRNPPDKRFKPIQYRENLSLCLLPGQILALYLDLGTQDCKDAGLLNSITYDLRDSCIEMRTLGSEMSAHHVQAGALAKSKHRHRNLSLGSDYLYSILDMLLDHKNSLDKSIFSHSGLEVKAIGTKLKPVFSDVFEWCTHGDSDGDSASLSFENYGELRNTVGVTGIVTEPFKMTEALKDIARQLKGSPEVLSIDD